MRSDPDARIPGLSDVAETVADGVIDSISTIIDSFFPSTDEDDDDE